MPKRNLVFIFTDQQRRETIGCYPGTPEALQTPHLNRLAAESVVFERAYCAQPVCTPSRSSILTGLYPHATGCVDNNRSLPAELPTLAEMVAPSYHRAYLGKWHLGNELSPQHGFTTWLSTEDNYVANKGNATAVMGASDYTHYLLEKGYPPDQDRQGVALFSRRQTAHLPEADFRTTYLGRQAAQFIRAAATRDEPFVLYVGFQEPHPPYLGPLDDLYPPERLPTGPTFRQRPPAEAARLAQVLAESFSFPADLYGLDMTTEAGWRKTRAKYYGLVTLVDRAVGAILNALDAGGLAENTAVVFTSDHGDMLGDHHLWGKSVLYEGAAAVPLLIRAPWLAHGPLRAAEPISQVDLVPTLLDLLDQPVPPGLHGRSQAARLAGVRPDAKDVVVEWNGTSGHHWHKSWKNTGPQPDLPWADVQGPWRSLVTPQGFKLNLAPHDRGELYDLQSDPDERHNLFHQPEHQPRVRDLADRLRAWQAQVGDTLPLPETA